MPAERVYLSLGSNLGDRRGALDRAVDALRLGGFVVSRSSETYETAPVGGPPQGAYLNRVIAGDTVLAPAALLKLCQAVEAAAGRVRGEANAARVLDVDVLLYGSLVDDGPELVLPHPRLHERRFVLVPLAELAPSLRHPRRDRTMAELLDECADRSAVHPWSAGALVP